MGRSKAAESIRSYNHYLTVYFSGCLCRYFVLRESLTLHISNQVGQRIYNSARPSSELDSPEDKRPHLVNSNSYIHKELKPVRTHIIQHVYHSSQSSVTAELIQSEQPWRTVFSCAGIHSPLSSSPRFFCAFCLSNPVFLFLQPCTALRAAPLKVELPSEGHVWEDAPLGEVFYP